ncbi:heterokaryon incompatibility protein-domain-containing protein [Nemania abortiva]|nr:heterokaryon incompatibility protein-domain-containing protein [Nemania abortiva]
MFEFEYDKIDNLPGGDYIRILSLAASETFTDLIYVTLPVALSYCWRDALYQRLIFCDGRPSPIMQNLKSALRHLRQVQGHRVLWIDAICINQTDLAERTADSNLVFPLCERMIEIWGDLINDGSIDFGGRGIETYNDQVDNRAAPPEEKGMGKEGVRDPAKEEVTASMQLVIPLAKEALVLCGTSSISWDAFFQVFVIILEGVRGNLSLAAKLRRSLHRTNNNVWVEHVDLLRLLWDTRDLDVTDPRDKVYSILGLIDPEEAQREDLVPDYTISVEECYKRAALAVMSYTRNPDVLSTEYNLESKLNSPSWVPDWVYLNSPAPYAILRHDDREDSKKSRYRKFCASTSSRWDNTGRVYESTLKLSGYVFDTIVELEDILTTPLWDPVDVNSASSSTGAFNSYMSLLGGLGARLDTLVKWERVALSRKYSKYPTCENPDTVLAPTMCTGNVDGPEGALTGFRQLRLLRRFGADSQIYKSLVAITGGIATLRYDATAYLAATDRTIFRRLGRTAKGYLAIVPGGKVPFVIRPMAQKREFELVGPSYVHGIMYGEAWDDSLAQDISIIHEEEEPANLFWG